MLVYSFLNIFGLKIQGIATCRVAIELASKSLAGDRQSNRDGIKSLVSMSMKSERKRTDIYFLSEGKTK